MLHSLPCKQCLYSGNRTYKLYHIKLCRIHNDSRAEIDFTNVYHIELYWVHRDCRLGINLKNLYHIELYWVHRDCRVGIDLKNFYHIELYWVHRDCRLGIDLKNFYHIELYWVHRDCRVGIDLKNFYHIELYWVHHVSRAGIARTSFTTSSCIKYTTTFERESTSQTSQHEDVSSTPWLFSWNSAHNPYNIRLYRIHHDILAGSELMNFTAWSFVEYIMTVNQKRCSQN